MRKGIILIALFLCFNAGLAGASDLYQVRPGDTLGNIAEKFQVTIEDLARWNQIQNIHNIVVGQTLRIAGEQDTQWYTYEVQGGDTLWRISREFNVPVEELMDLNSTGHTIYPHQVLKIRPLSGGIWQYHDVQPGESLWTISREYQVPIDDLINLNDIRGHIYPGDSLRIRFLTMARWNLYVVQAGETLEDISEEFGIPLDHLMEYNGFFELQDLESGQEIIVPMKYYPNNQ